MLLAISSSDVGRQSALMESVFCFRHAIFIEEKGWNNLGRPDGLEGDPFDDEHAVHHVCLRDDEIAGYQRLLPTTHPHLLTEVLSDLRRTGPPKGPRILEWMRFCVAPGGQKSRSRPDCQFLGLALGVVEWGLARGIDMAMVAIDWRLMVAMRLRFFARPSGSPKRVGGEEGVALRMSFNRETRETIREARRRHAPVLAESALEAAA
jgi:acyl-homoserine lactone synthase